MENLNYKVIPVGVGEDELHPDVVERERDRLLKFFRVKLNTGQTGSSIKTLDDAISSVARIVNKAIAGYKRASERDTPEETFIARISFLSKYDKMPEIWNDTPKEKPKKKKERVELQVAGYEDIDEVEEDTNQIPVPSFLVLEDPDEQKFFEQRKRYYLTEFEFNDSSDQMLLETVLSDEVLLRRYTNAKLNFNIEAVSGLVIDDKTIAELQARYRLNLKSLGVSREQRIADNTNQKGNIAQLSETLDKKIEEIRALTDISKREKIIKRLITDFSMVSLDDVYNLIEELEFMRQRALRAEMENLEPIPTMNSLPASTEIDAILKDMNKKELN